MSAVVLPAASAAFTSTQVIFSNSTRSACARGAACADPATSIREAVPPAINISKECETEPMRMSFASSLDDEVDLDAGPKRQRGYPDRRARGKGLTEMLCVD